MNHSRQPMPTKPPRLLDRLMRRLAFRGLRRVAEGTIEVQDGKAVSRFGMESTLHAMVRAARSPLLSSTVAWRESGGSCCVRSWRVGVR